MKRGALIGTIAGAVLVLGGAGVAVGASLAAQPEADPTPSISVSATADPSPSTSPTVDADTPRVSGTPVPGADADTVFLAYVKDQTPNFTETKLPDMSSDELIAAGHTACKEIAAGTPTISLRLVAGEKPSPMGDYLDSSAIFNGAITAYCPELVAWPENY